MVRYVKTFTPRRNRIFEAFCNEIEKNKVGTKLERMNLEFLACKFGSNYGDESLMMLIQAIKEKLIEQIDEVDNLGSKKYIRI